MKKSPSFQPELLLPAGNPKAFHAALLGGANAVYVGLQQFNARNRATNFTPWQLAAMINLAHQKGVKIYVTLNTVIRNSEINQLIDTLYLLSQMKPDAVIVQDWGLVYLIRKYFPNLTIHASTQMANHNSVGANFSKKAGIERVVMARELTKNELKEIVNKSKVEIELFIHGALCYSFSGMCLFSSFVGGSSANRGQCTQPCRRNYKQNEKELYFFSLKDNQLIEHLPFLQELKIDSLKVEGRLKSADYVYQVAKAYRKALDHPELRVEAHQELSLDLGREKTDYFYGKNIKEAITQSASAGLFLGVVKTVSNGTVVFESNMELKNDSKLRFRNSSNDEQIQLSINRFNLTGNDYSFQAETNGIQAGDEVYLAAIPIQIPAKINTDGVKVYDRCPEGKLKNIKREMQLADNQKKQEVFLRIDQFSWISEINFDDFDGVIINLSHKEWGEFKLHQPLLQKNSSLIHFELPKFIPEADLEFYRQRLQQLTQAGFHNLFLSHLSQKELLPNGSTFSTNENVYLFNDAAIKMIKSEGVSHYIYPLENDIVNLSQGTDRGGIIPVYFYPHLFYSRMPVIAEKEEIFTDINGEKFRKLIRDGMTIIVPDQPVSITQFKSKLDRYGFHRYLIDLSTMQPETGLPFKLKKKLLYSDKISNTSLFNFKRELK